MGVILVHRPPNAGVACVPYVAMSWRSELTGRRADVARGTTIGCDVALRPRGRAADGHAWLTRVRMADTCARIYHIDYIIGYRTYKPILRTG